MSHYCNEDCRRQYYYGYNCAAGQNPWKSPNPPWQENGFWGGGIEPDKEDLERIKCHSERYRAGYKAYHESKTTR